MLCQEAEHRLFDLIDGRLPPADELRLFAHLEDCASCRARTEAWQALVPEMRALAPEAPSELRRRRMEVGVERALAEPLRAPSSPRFRPALRLLVPIGLAAAAAVAIFAVTRPAPPDLDGRTRTGPGLAAEGSRPDPGTVAAAGSTVDVPSGAQTDLRVGRAASVRVRGPARLAVGGGDGAVRLRLDSGELEASVDKRLPGETFVVELKQGRVEVRGTRFSVGYAGDGAWVRVAEGRVAAYRAGEAEERAVAAGETLWLAPETRPQRKSRAGGRLDAVPEAERTTAKGAPPPIRQISSGAPAVRAAGTSARPDLETEAAPPMDPPRPAVALPPEGAEVTCPDVRKSCESGAARARAAMRDGASSRVLRIVDEARRGWSRERACPVPPEACVDELLYLRAEALQLEGQLGAALDAYRALDREGAPPATRQNALYAAAEIQRRLGRQAAARRDFDRAFEIAPTGALREEAMVGSMEAAVAAGEPDVAVDRARRYLDAYPSGLAAARAREILRRGAGPGSAGKP